MSCARRWVLDSCACKGIMNASRQLKKNMEKVFMSKKEAWYLECLIYEIGIVLKYA
jgi:hypothetical protein